MAGVVGFALGDQHSLVLKQDGSVWRAGARAVISAHGVANRFVQVIKKSAMDVAAGFSYNMVLMQDGSVWATGNNVYGQLGDGTRITRDSFVFVQNFPGAKSVAAGSHHTMILTYEGEVWAVGWNKFGQLGKVLGTYKLRFFMTMLSAKAMAAGDTHSVVVMQDGSVWATGQNQNGQLGDGSREDRGTFVKVMSTPWGSYNGATDVSAGGYHSLVLKADGSVWVTGKNKDGQLGLGSTKDKCVYTQVVSCGVKAVAAGGQHSMVLNQDGSVWSTGNNVYGQLGDGSSTDRAVFVQVISGGVKVIAAGAFHTMVLKEDGSVWAAGSNQFGQFGSGWSSYKVFTKLSLFGDGPALFMIIYSMFACVHRSLTTIIHSTDDDFESTTKVPAHTLSVTETEMKPHGGH